MADTQLIQESTPNSRQWPLAILGSRWAADHQHASRKPSVAKSFTRAGIAATWAQDSLVTGALLDRLIHQVSILTMNSDSYRLKEADGRRRAAAT